MFLLSPPSPLTSSVPQLQGLQLAWLNGTHTCTLLDLPGRIITGYYRGAGFLGCVIQVQGCTRYSTPSVIILKIKNKKYSFSNKNGCFISRRRRGNVRPVACKIIVFWMFKPFANEREIFFNDGFSFMGHMELWILPLFRAIRSPLGWGKHCECVAQSGAHLQCWEVVWHFHFYLKNKNAIKRACFWIAIYYVQTRYILYFQLSLLSKYNKDKMKLKFALMVSCVIMW